MIDRMTKGGLLTVSVDAANRRRKLVSLTAAGHAMLEKMTEQAKRAEAMITADLDPEDITELKRLLSKLGDCRTRRNPA